MQTPNLSVDAVIPALNEAGRVGAVVETVRSSGLVGRILVVNDGSEDGTAAEAQEAGAQVLDLPETGGKAHAMLVGAMASQAEYLLFLDADLIGLTAGHVRAMLDPVARGETRSTVGIFEQGRGATDWAQAVSPWLSGQRVIPRQIFLEISGLDDMGYGVEVAITRHLSRLEIKPAVVSLVGMSHLMKEEKTGFFKGAAKRMAMYGQICATMLENNGSERKRGKRV